MNEGSPQHWYGPALSRPTTVAALRVVHADAAEPHEDGSPGGLTLTEVAHRAAVSRASSEDAVNELIQRELLAEIVPDPDAPRPVGRPAKRYRFRAEYGAVIGVDIGIHKVLALCTDLVGTIRGSHRIEVSAEHSNAERVQAAHTALKRAARAASVRLADVLAVGVGTTGPVDPNTGTIALSPALPEWSGVDIRKELTGLGSGPVIVGNDANLGALAEHWRGIARDAPDVVYILAGHQFSVGILIDGRVRQGRHGAAGEIGVLKAARWYEARDALAAGKSVDDPAFIDDLATGAAECRRMVLYSSNHSATAWRASHGKRSGTAIAVPSPGVELNASATALSSAEAVRPIDWVIPAAAQSRLNSSPVYSPPRVRMLVHQLQQLEVAVGAAGPSGRDQPGTGHRTSHPYSVTRGL